MDKWEAHLPNKVNFMHTDYCVSLEQEKFHMTNAYCARQGDRRGFRIGTQKRLPRMTGLGVLADRKYVGKANS